MGREGGREGQSKSVALLDKGVMGHKELSLTLSCSSRIAGGGIEGAKSLYFSGIGDSSGGCGPSLNLPLILKVT